MSLIHLLALTVAFAGDRYVEVSGNDSANTCEASATPCATLEAATLMAQEGETIFLGAGTFSSTASLYPIHVGDGVSVQGMGPGVTTVRGNGPLLEVGMGNGETQYITDLSLDVLMSNQSALMGFDDLDLTLDNLTVTGGNTALDLSESSHSINVYVQNTDFDDVGTALSMYGFGGSAHATLDNVTINGGDTAMVGQFGSSSGSYGILADNLTITNAAGAADIELHGTSTFMDIDLSDVTLSNLMDGLHVDYSGFNSGSVRLIGTNATAVRSPFAVSASSMANVEVTVADFVGTDIDGSSGTQGSNGATLRTSLVDIDLSQVAAATGLYVQSTDFADHLAAMRHVSIDGGTSGLKLDSGFGAHMGPTLDDITIQSTRFPIQVSASFDGFVEADMRNLTLSEYEGTAMTLVGSGGFGVEVHDASMTTTLPGARGVDMYTTTRGSLLLNGTTISGGYQGISVSGSTMTSNAVASLEVRRSSITDTEEAAIYFGNCFFGTCTLDINRSSIRDNGNAGVHIGHAPPGNASLTIENSVLMNNAMLYGYGSAYNGFDVAAVSSSSAVVDASSNWWGTTNQAQIQGRVQSYGQPVDTTPAWDSAHTFQVAPPRGTPRGGELLLVREPGAPSLVDRMGDAVAQVLVGGTPAEVLWSARNGDMLRVKVPPMTPGLYDVDYIGPDGNTGLLPGAYEVEDAPDVLSMRHQAFVTGTGTYVRASNASAGADLRIYFSPSIEGPPACPPELQGGCLQIPGPLAVARASTADPRGIAWERIGPPSLATHPTYVTGQVVEIFPGGGFSVSPVVLQAWAQGSDDEDEDGVSNREEHRVASSIYARDSDGDGCHDDEDRQPFRPQGDDDQTGRPDDCERW